MLFHDQPHSLSVTHSLTLTSVLLWAGGWSRQPPKALPTKSSSDSNTCGSKDQFINPLLASQTNTLPHDILRLKACKFSYSAVITKLHPKSSPECPEHISSLFLPVWMDTLPHTYPICFHPNWSTHWHLQPLSLPATQASIFIIKYY